MKEGADPVEGARAKAQRLCSERSVIESSLAVIE